MVAVRAREVEIDERSHGGVALVPIEGSWLVGVALVPVPCLTVSLRRTSPHCHQSANSAHRSVFSASNSGTILLSVYFFFQLVGTW
jgi:hypothetical protein